MKIAVGFIAYEEASARYLADFLTSLERALLFLPEQDYRVFAYDNSPAGGHNRHIVEAFNYGSGSVPRLRQPIDYSGEGRNRGFSQAYNIMIRKAAVLGAEYFLVINPDTCLNPDAIQQLLAALEAAPAAAAAAPKLLVWDFLNRRKTEQIDSLGIYVRPGLVFRDLGQGERDFEFTRREKIIGPSGAAGLYRLSALTAVAETAGGQAAQYFDESFFMYKEDCDLAYRLYRAGKSCLTVPEAVIYHDRTATAIGRGLSRTVRGRQEKSRQVRAWSFRNQHLIYLKHWPQEEWWSRLLIVARSLVFLIFSLIFEQFLLKEYREVWRLRNR